MGKTKVSQVKLLQQKLTTIYRRFQTYASGISSESEDIHVQSKLEIFLNKVDTLVDNYTEAYAELELLESVPDNSVTADDFFENALSLQAKAKTILASLNAVSLPSGNQTITNVNKVLPNLQVPIFNGKLDEYITFKANFKSIIDTAQLDDVQRLMYLKSALKNDASSALSGLPVANENYLAAWNLLDERFHKPKLIVRSHIASVFNSNPVQKGSSSALQNFVDELNKNLSCLKLLGIEKESLADALIYHLIESKLDVDSQEKLRQISLNEVPTISKIIKFLQDRVSILVNTKGEAVNKINNKITRPIRNHALVSTTDKIFKCFLCKDSHIISKCPKFLALNVNDRIQRAKELKVCPSCLGHSLSQPCRSKLLCPQCKKSHHNLLHIAKESNDVEGQTNLVTDVSPSPQAGSSTSMTVFSNSVVLLATAEVNVRNSRGVPVRVRALLDNGSMHSLISNRLIQKLDLPVKPVNFSLVGISGQTTTISHYVELCINSRASRFRTNVECLVIEKITSPIPSITFDCSHFPIPANVVLADPNFNVSSEIDLLIGADQFYNLLCVGQFSLGENMPILQKTKLGYIVTGTVYPRSNSNLSFNCLLATSHICFDLQRFWELDKIPEPDNYSILSSEGKFCMKHFEETVVRADDKRLVVSIPFNNLIDQLGDSYSMALNRFLALERRLNRCPELKIEYSKFIQEYFDLNHLTEITENNLGNFNFLPHHEVLKPGSSSTKLRVVFDGSAKTASGLSLNDCQYNGPVLQRDLFSILLNFRKYPVALTADCTKMYRQLWLAPQQRKFQCILWRPNSSEDVKALQLSTVTYGLRSSSFLAVRSLNLIADECSLQYPQVAVKIKTEFYMDDFISGADSVEEALQLRYDVTAILSASGIPLRKFSSNKMSVLNKEDVQAKEINFQDSNSKALGISWHPAHDTFMFNWSIEGDVIRVTKRDILSSLSKLFDPLGFISPIVVIGKLLIQELWKNKVSWDETISLNLQTRWKIFSDGVSLAPTLRVPRYIIFKEAEAIELHCFSDASSVAYGSCLYVRSIFPDRIELHILCSKGRVAPLKTVSLPRLELSAAVLSAELANKVSRIFPELFRNTFFWTDSKIVLGWLNSAPYLFQVFVANRIARIQELTNALAWKHVASSDNPADLVSRGCNFQQLLNEDIWFHGPKFLRSAFFSIPTDIYSNFEELPEQKSVKPVLTVVFEDNVIDHLINKFSSLFKLQRVFAYVLRFTQNCRISKDTRNKTPLNALELANALNLLALRVQKVSFSNERFVIAKQGCKGIKSIPMLSLNLFLDKPEILRVGGRIRNSNLNYDKIHPILLPKNHPFSRLVVSHFHSKFLHCGPRQLMSVVREKFWIISLKLLCKDVVRKCVTCFKCKPTAVQPLMGDIPSFRFAFFQRCFTNCGLDFAGPVLIKDRYTRKPQILKAYIAVFVCLTSRAVHLELVTSLSADAFLEVLKRFISRRGQPLNIYSDNATNFTASADQLKELYQWFSDKHLQGEIFDYLANRGISWHFIPPSAPHFGGMWEAGVRSVKFHLVRILRDLKLTFEGLMTILTQIEGTLNSRPLAPISSDPNDFRILTPFHLLTGSSFEPIPEIDISHLPDNRLDQYQMRQKIVNHFWKRFRLEVLPEYQTRTKWSKDSNNMSDIQVGRLAVLNESNSPPFRWPVARILSTHPRKDGRIRVVTLRLPSGTICKRPVVKVHPLPLSV